MAGLVVNFSVDIDPVVKAAERDVVKLLEDGHEERMKEVSAHITEFYRQTAKNEVQHKIKNYVSQIVDEEMGRIFDKPFRDKLRKEIRQAVADSQEQIRLHIQQSVDQSL